MLRTALKQKQAELDPVWTQTSQHCFDLDSSDFDLVRFSQCMLFATPWTIARQAPLSMGFSRQEYWSGLPCPPPGDLSDPGIVPKCLTFPALAGVFFTTSATWEAPDLARTYFRRSPLV